jgi:hypothetical protein
METPEDVNLLNKAKNFGGAIYDWATTDKFSSVSSEDFQIRHGICNSCPHWKPTDFGGMGGCSLCGCSVLKLYIPSSVCPDIPARWNSISAPDK